MGKLIKKAILENLILKADRANRRIIVVSDETDAKKASQETFRSKEILKKNNFTWEGGIKAWVSSEENFEHAKKILSDINKTEGFIQRLEDLEEYVQNAEDFQGKGNLMDKLGMYVNDLANTTDEVSMSAEIRRYLTFFANFKGHSFTNTMLIYLQNNKATRVAGFRQWEKKFNRRVVKGAKGIMIFAPIFLKDDETNDTGLDQEAMNGRPSPVRFRPVYVFDIADTEAINANGEIPETPEWFTNEEPTEVTKQLYGYLAEVCDNLGINLTHLTANGGEKGYSAGNHINMSSTVQGAGEVSTLVHEIAHELMHRKASSLYYQGDDVIKSRELKELQAESVSYVVVKHYGLPVTHHPTYLALWKANKDKILANLKVVSEVAKFIIESVDKEAAASEVVNNNR